MKKKVKANETNEHMKGCSVSLIIREMQIKITVRCHLKPTKMVTITSIGKDVETLQSLYTVDGKEQ